MMDYVALFVFFFSFFGFFLLTIICRVILMFYIVSMKTGKRVRSLEYGQYIFACTVKDDAQ